MLNYEELFNGTWLYKTCDFSCNLDQTTDVEYVWKEVKVVDLLDGPGSDRRDYVTVEGINDWEVDMPLENFLKNARLMKEAA
tara:strand:- start:632 stop:877 length:246 start_codon:yes stop_codon:yes gene_type:complete